MTAPNRLKLHHFALSGHSHRVQLMLSLMGLPHDIVPVDLKRGEHKSAAFLKLNPFGQVPVLEDGDTALFDSNAILVYLAKKAGRSDWLPEDAAGAARVQRWLSVAAGLIAFGPASARMITLFGSQANAEEVIGRAHRLLQVMEGVLGRQNFLTGATATLADVAGYSYIAAAPEGNVDLAPYPHVRAWLARIEALPGFVPFPRSAVGLVA